MKYVLVTGGVVSGLGKGVTASSIGVVLKNCGHRVTSIKIGKPLSKSHAGPLGSQIYPEALTPLLNVCRPLPEHRCRHDVPL